MTSSTPEPVLVQLSDLHVGADWGGGDPVAMLATTVESVLALDVGLSGVLVTGDLADHASDGEYEQVLDLLAPLEAPLHVLPGNHDDRAALRRHFGVPGAGGDPVGYAAEAGSLRVVALDSTRPGEDRGELDDARLDRLDETLGAAPDRPTLLALHHTPLRTGMPEIDEVGLPAADRDALAAVIARHPQVRRIAGGHLHQTVAGTLGRTPVLAAPSTYVRIRLGFGPGELELAPGPSGFVVHALRDGVLVSHVEPVTRRG